MALLAPATFFQGYDDLILSLALVGIRDSFHLSVEAAGAMVSLANLGAFGALVLLPLADRVGRRPVLVWTIAGYAVASFATAFTRNPGEFVAAQMAARTCLGAEYALALIVLVELFEGERSGRRLGLVTSMSAFGQAGAGLAFLIVVLAFHGSWRVLYVVGTVPLLLVARARRDLPETVAARPPAGRGPVRALAGVRLVWLAGAVLLQYCFLLFPTAVITFASWLVLREWGWTLHTLNPLAIVVWVLAVTGFFVGGRLADAVGRRPTLVAFALGAAGAGMVAFHATTTGGRVLGLAAVIFCLTGTTPCVAALGIEPFPSRARGAVGAILRVAGIAGSVTAPALTGFLAGRLGGVAPALSVMGLSYVAAAVVTVALLPETRGAASEPPALPPAPA